MIFTVLGAVAELERTLITEQVRAGIRNAKGKGVRVGCPAVVIDMTRIAALRSHGLGWARGGGPSWEQVSEPLEESLECWQNT